MQDYQGAALPEGIERLWAQYDGCRNEQNGQRLWQEIWVFGDSLQKAGNLSAAEGAYLSCCELASELVQAFGTDAAVRCLGTSYESLGAVLRAEGRFSEAEAYLKQATAQFGRLIYADQSRAIRKDIRVYTASLTELGQLYQAQGRFSEAWKAYQDGMAPRRDLFLESGQPVDGINLSFSYQYLAELAEGLKRPVQALLYYQQAAGLQRRILTQAQAKLPLPEETLLLVFSDNVMGAIVPLTMHEDYAQAREFGERSLPLFRRMAALSNDIFSCRRLSVLLECLGNICREEGDLNGAAIYYKECLELRTALLDKAGENPELLDDLALIYYNIALKETGNNQRLLFDRAEKIWARLAVQYPGEPLYQRRLNLLAGRA